MGQCFQAIYEHGVLRPLEPLALRETEVVSLAIQGRESEAQVAPSPEEERLALSQRELLLKFVAKMESLPDNTPQDGLSNRDHDQLIYGS
jgi:predicted DNA-binding antitoxin AbrB/MazE fold protein